MATSDLSDLEPDIESLEPLHWVGIVLAAITGVIHLFLAVTILGGMGVLFLLAGLGFFGAIVLLVLNVRRDLIYIVGIPYTAIQIPLWYVMNDLEPADLVDPGIGTFDKLVQVLLIVVLIVLIWQERE